MAQPFYSLRPQLASPFLRVDLCYKVLDHSLKCPKIGTGDVLRLARVVEPGHRV
jgi:hypothetical protein